MCGHPISHSLSPVIHAAAYRRLGVEAVYASHDVREEGFAEFVGRTVAAPAGPETWAGLSVTMPLKNLAAELADRRSPDVEAFGVANTLVRGQDGTVHAHNTDIAGIRHALSESPGWRKDLRESPEDHGPALVVGGGATAISALAALRRLGWRSVRLAQRRPEASPAWKAAADHLGMEWEITALDALPPARVSIWTLPPHAADDAARGFPVLAGATALDVAYRPWPSVLASHVTAQGGTAVSGVEMLLHQAVDQVRLFLGGTGRDPAGAARGDLAQAMRAALSARLGG